MLNHFVNSKCLNNELLKFHYVTSSALLSFVTGYNATGKFDNDGTSARFQKRYQVFPGIVKSQRTGALNLFGRVTN